MHVLDQAHLADLPADMLRPGYERSGLRAGIAHIGVGAFHRAHQAIYLDRYLAHSGARDWGLVGIGLLPQDRGMAEAMRAQNGLYTVSELAPDGSRNTRVVECMLDYLYAPDDPEHVLSLLASPQIRIVSLTITEGGYLIDDQGRFKLDNPAVARDLADPTRPESVFGYLVEALDRRRRAGIAPFTVMSCDNLRHNGTQAKRACLGYAAARDAELAAWIEAEVSFPNGMVDRITPAMDEAGREALNAQTGVADRAPVVCEDFIQWVLEDRFCNGRPDWFAVGVTPAADVAPYEDAKLRLLNAAHLMLAYPAYLAGHRKVDAALRDPPFADYLRDYLDQDAGPWLHSLPGMELDGYKKLLLQRFGNRAIGDQLARLCLDGGSKTPGFILPTFDAVLGAGQDGRRIAYYLACYDHYLRVGHDDRGEAYEIREPNAWHLLEPVAASDTPLALLEVTDVVGTLASKNPRFVALYLEYAKQLELRGARVTLLALDRIADSIAAS